MKKKSQSQRFIEKARALGCDENEAAFDKALKRVTTHKPTSSPKKKRRNRAK